MMARDNRKGPRQKLVPQTGKNPRSEPEKQGSDSQKIRWKFSVIDREGPWGFGRITEGEFWGILLPKLRDYEKLTWAEIYKHPHNHPIPKDSIVSAARTRLQEINQDDTDNLVSLSTSGLPRLWGIRANDEFRVLWWDPQHQIYPTSR